MTQAKIIERIKKLMALSTSNNEHEAAQAAARAADLLAKHQLTEACLDEHGDAPGPIEQFDLDSGMKRVHWKGILASGVCKAFGCAMYYRTNRSAGQRQVALVMVGRQADVDTVRYMYMYLVCEVDRLASHQYLNECKQASVAGISPPGARAWKNAFRLGAAGIIQDRLIAQRRATFSAAARDADEEMTRALVRVEDDEQQISAWMRQNLRLRKGGGASYTSAGGYHHGRRAGADLDLGQNHAQLDAPALQLPAGVA